MPLQYCVLYLKLMQNIRAGSAPCPCSSFYWTWSWCNISGPGQHLAPPSVCTVPEVDAIYPGRVSTSSQFNQLDPFSRVPNPDQGTLYYFLILFGFIQVIKWDGILYYLFLTEPFLRHSFEGPWVLHVYIINRKRKHDTCQIDCFFFASCKLTRHSC